MTMKKYVFGIDVGGTTIKCGLFQTDGTLLEKWEIPTRTEHDGDQILPDVAKTVLDKISEKGIAKEEVAGVGIDVPGPVNEKGEIAVAVNLNWGYKDIVGELGSAMGGIPVQAANDANAAALGEMWGGGGRGAKTTTCGDFHPVTGGCTAVSAGSILILFGTQTMEPPESVSAGI